ncbi:MAG: glycosyltransferase family 4 protein, partial [Burkholderiales bacterium]
RMLARYREIAGRAAAIICVSSHTAQVLRGYLEESRIAVPAIHIVPLGVNPGFVPAPEEQKYEIRRLHGLQKPFFFFYGLPAENKNIDRLLQAFARRGSALADYELVIAGPAAEETVRSLHLRAAELGIAEYFRHVGRLAERELPVMLSAAAALTFPSLYEGFGLPILEAMACGTPVLTSLGHATEEVAAGLATLVDPHSVEDIAAGLARVVSTPEAARTRARDYGHAMTWRRTAEQTLAVYRSVLGRTAIEQSPP